MKPAVVFHVLGTLQAGGAERYLLSFLKALDRTRWESVVCSMQGGILHDEFSQIAQTYVLHKTRKVDPRIPLRLRKLMDRHQPAIVHTYLSTGNTWGRLAVALNPVGRPVVIASEHNIDTWKNALHLLADRMLLGVTDAVTGVSQAVSDYLVAHDRVPDRMVRTIPNGIDLARAQRHLGDSGEQRDALRAQFGFRPEHFVIGHVARPGPAKGLDVLVDVVDRMRAESPVVRLLRVSQSPLPREEETARRFARAVRDHGLTDIISQQPFTADISAMYCAMDALVQTSTHEGMPTVVMEAMAMEKPVVVTAAGGTGEVVRHRVNGWIVPIGDRDGLVEGLRYVRGHPRETALWGKAARKLIETEYTDEVMIRRTVALYEELLARRSGGQTT